MTPIGNDRGRFQSPHANVLGRLVPNCLPMGKKAEMRQWVHQTNEAHHGEIREVSLERAEEKSAVDRPNPICPHSYYYSSLSFCIAHDIQQLQLWLKCEML